jgi:hypothetical protein
MMLTQAPSGVVISSPRVQTFADWNPNSAPLQMARICIGNQQSTPTGLGDFVGRLSTKLGALQPSQSKSVTYRYRRI